MPETQPTKEVRYLCRHISPTATVAPRPRQIDELELQLKAFNRQNFVIFEELKAPADQDPAFKPAYEIFRKASKARNDGYNLRHGFAIEAIADERVIIYLTQVAL